MSRFSRLAYWLKLASLLAILAFECVSHAPAQPEPRHVLADGCSWVATLERDVRDATPADRTPLFDNAPFLRLRSGDALVRAREQPHLQGKPSADPERVRYYLHSGGRYLLLSADEEDGKLRLQMPEESLLFDWEPTLENVRVLRKLLVGDYATSLTTEQLTGINQAVRRKFPEAIVSTESSLVAERAVPIPGHPVFEFQGWAYDRTFDNVYRYTVRIGPSDFVIYGDLLIKGPPVVRREEFKPVRGEQILNAGPPTNPRSKTAREKRAAWERMVAFQKLLEPILRQQLVADP